MVTARWTASCNKAATGLRLSPVSREAYREAAALARHAGHGLRAGDALHLATALAAGAQNLATLDANQAENARRLKLKTAGFL